MFVTLNLTALFSLILISALMGAWLWSRFRDYWGDRSGTLEQMLRGHYPHMTEFRMSVQPRKVWGQWNFTVAVVPMGDPSDSAEFEVSGNHLKKSN